MRHDSIGMFWEDAAKIKLAKEKFQRTAPERIWEKENYLPHLDVARRYVPDLMTDQEILNAAANKELFVFDIESYVNVSIIAFRSLLSGKIIYFEQCEEEDLYWDLRKLEWVIKNLTIVSFNGIGYDIPIASLALKGFGSESLKAATNLIIGSEIRPSDVLKQFKVKSIAKELDHIDLMEVAPLRGSLKIYAGRCHTPLMQDLPFPHEMVLSADHRTILRWYLMNDLSNTALLAKELSEQLQLRVSLSREYGIDVRSKLDAQIAEALIVTQTRALNGYHERKPSIPAGTSYQYKVPSFIKYESDLMNWVLNRVRNAYFIVQENGTIGLPPEIADIEIKMNKGSYKMGIGGLHSMEKKTAHVATKKKKIKDTDFDSFYPLIIIGQQLYPHHLGPNFLRVYSTFVKRRLEAKARGDKVASNSLKIVINGSFGKLGSPFSDLYAPHLLFQVTITGQLILLMFIERLELAGFEVISANTDGVVALVPDDKEELFQSIVASVRKDTGFTTEETEYSGLYSRDVNNYVAVKMPDKEGKIAIKGKGVFANPWHPDNKKDAIFRFHKNPQNLICVDAIMELLRSNKPIRETIYQCTDITKFVTVRHVKEGGVKSYAVAPSEKTADFIKIETIRANGFTQASEKEWWPPNGSELGVVTLDAAFKMACTTHTVVEYLGESIRWYYAKGVHSDIMYAKNGNAVPKSKGAKPIMNLPNSLPEDLDHEWYVQETESMLRDIAYLA